MKRVLLIIIGLFLLVCSAGCKNSDTQNFYGTYTFEKVARLSPLSSSTPDYINEQMAGTKYTIEADLFKIETADNTVEIKSPEYVKEEIKNDLASLSDIYTSVSDEVKYQYTVYKEDGNKTNWRLYVSPDDVWIGSYVDNTANGSEIIMYIYKLSK